MSDHPLPQDFILQMSAQLAADADAFFASLQKPAFRGLRLNSRKPISCDLSDIGDKVPWNAVSGRYLSADSTLGGDPLHEAGAFYIQEPSAMAPVSLLSPQRGERILDLCAAPGGKSTQIADALQGTGLLVCNEPVAERANVLSRNIERMGVTNALVVSALPEALCKQWKNAFDAILVDAPCSGEGMFRKHPETRDEWSIASTQGCAARQLGILRCAAQMLKGGGRMVYSTCTYNHAENEGVMEALLQAEPSLHLQPFRLPVGEDRFLNAPNGMAHLYPHELKGEGHFAALLLKDGNDEPETDFQPASKCFAAPAKPMVQAYCAFASKRELPIPNAQKGDLLLACPDLPPVKGIRVLRAGIHLGTLKGKVFAPDHALAMALPIPYSLPTVAFSREDALLYQSGEVLPCPDQLSGYVLPTYQGLALGFGKCSNGQMKNHYPKGLRRRGGKEEN